jgi:hypothetical protein
MVVSSLEMIPVDALSGCWRVEAACLWPVQCGLQLGIIQSDASTAKPNRHWAASRVLEPTTYAHNDCRVLQVAVADLASPRHELNVCSAAMASSA